MLEPSETRAGRSDSGPKAGKTVKTGVREGAGATGPGRSVGAASPKVASQSGKRRAACSDAPPLAAEAVASDAAAHPARTRRRAGATHTSSAGHDDAVAVEELATGSGAPEPRSLEKALGAQIRHLRRERDISQGELAAAAGVSLGMMSKIEHGQISPSLSTINAVASALNAPFTSLFAAFEDKRDCSHVPRGRGVVIERRASKAGHVYELLGAVLGGDVVVEPYLITLREDARPYTGFRHAGTELIFMLSGELTYRHGDDCYRLSPGDALLFDSAALHGPEQLDVWPISFLSVITYPRR